MIVLALTVINLIATCGLVLALFGMANANNLKIDLNFFITVLIAVLFSACAIFLSLKSLGYYVLYGLIVAAVDLFFMVIGQRGIGAAVLGLVISFLCWPQFICFVLFLLIHTEMFEK